MITNHHKNIATLLHISALSQYIFPLGNYIAPIVLWSFKKDESDFVDQAGKNVLNFQLSLLLYSLVMLVLAGPLVVYLLIHNYIDFDCTIIHINHFSDIDFENNWFVIGMVSLIVFLFFKIIEFFLIIYGALKTANGAVYKYPLTIPFFK